MSKKKITDDYILGLVNGKGCFSFSTRPGKHDNRGNITKQHIPSFTLSMHHQNEDLLEKIKDHLGLKNKIYIFGLNKQDKFKTKGRVVLVVREFGQLKDIIVPFFYHRLIGYKRQQFFEWLDVIGNDPSVPETFKFLHWLHSRGWYERNRKYID